MNLGWKLAAEVNGTAPAWLLDSYEPERRPVGASVIEISRAQEELASATTPGEMAVRDLFAEILDEHREVNRSIAERVSALAVAYPSEEGSHQLTGHRAPDLQLDGPVGVHRLWELLRDGHFALLTRRDKPQRQIEHAAVTHAVVPEQDVAQWGGADTALVRPDGYFAWLGAREQTATALARWIEGVAAPARGASVN